MRKPSEIRADMRALLETPGIGLSPLSRQQYLTDAQRAEIDDAESRLNTLRSEMEALVNRVGTKLDQLRDVMVEKKQGDEYARFRFAGRFDDYPIDSYQQEGFTPGGVYMQPEDDRERMIDAKAAEVGLTFTE